MTYCTHELRARRVPEVFVTLRLMRRRYRLTLPELAAMLRVHHCTLQRWETGKHKPSKRLAARLSDFNARWAELARDHHAAKASRSERAYQRERARRGQLRIPGT